MKYDEKSAYLILDDQLHGQCASYQLYIQGKQSNELVSMGRLLGRPLPFRDDVQHAFLGRRPWNHGEVLRIYDATRYEKIEKPL